MVTIPQTRGAQAVLRHLDVNEEAFLRAAVGYALDNPSDIKDWLRIERFSGEEYERFGEAAPVEEPGEDIPVAFQLKAVMDVEEVGDCVISDYAVGQHTKYKSRWKLAHLDEAGRIRAIEVTRAAWAYYHGGTSPSRNVEIVPGCGRLGCVAALHLEERQVERDS